MRRAIMSSPWRWPITRELSVSARCSTASISFFTIRPTGMPVQSATTEATACPSTVGRMRGVSPCIWASPACFSFSSASHCARSSAVGTAASAGAGAAAGGPGSAPPLASAVGEAPAAAALASATFASSTGLPPARSLPRSSRIESTSSFSCCQRSVRTARRSRSPAMAFSAWARRSPASNPTVSSRPMISSSVCSPSMRRCASSTSAGVACCEIATRAHAVSSRLTALSGNCRAGI